MRPTAGKAALRPAQKASRSASLAETRQHPWVWGIHLALALPLVWRRRWPIGVFGVLALVGLVQWALGLRLVAVVPEVPIPRAAGWADPILAADDVKLARDLGADILALEGSEPAAVLTVAARRVRASHVVLPARSSSLGDRLLGRSVVERLTAAELGIEVHLTTARGAVA